MSDNGEIGIWEGRGWIRHGLIWGGFMYLFMIILVPLVSGEEITMKELLIGIPFWALGGLGYGYTMKEFMARRKKKG